MFQRLPIDVQSYIFRSYFSTSEKINLLRVKEFEKALATKYSWKHLPKISLKTYMCISKKYLHILKPGLYISHSSKSLYEIVLKEKTGVLTLESFTLGNKKVSSVRRSATTKYSVSEFQELLIKIRKTSSRISEYSYFNNEIYISLEKPEMFKENIIYRTGFDQLSCLRGKDFYLMDILKTCPISHLEFHMREFIRKRGTYSERRHSYNIVKLTHWRKCLKSFLKVNYTYRPRKKVVEVKGVRKLMHGY